MSLFDAALWQSFPPTTLSDAALDWFTDKNSLTKRLREFTHNTIEHHLFFNNWDPKKENWIRDMEWKNDDQTWLHCLVIIPKESFIDELQDVGHRSIGDILFVEPSLSRSDFEYQEKNAYYSRRSIFHFKEKPFELIETFFPAFFQAIS
ncbi:MAG: chorismate lyase [Coxiellaceae bacterium]|nr:chorismate lyase [Coxiellaceae bacterium]